MGRVWSSAEAVGNPDVGILVQISHLVGEIVEIYRISGGAAAFVNSYSQRSDAAVRLIHEAQIRLAEWEVGTELSGFRYCRVDAGILEDVAEARRQPIEDVSPGIDWHRSFANLRDPPEIVYSMAMVGMIVGDDHAIDTVDLSGQQLSPHIGSAIDQQPLSGALDQDGRPTPQIAWFRRIAGAPIIPDPRYACRGAAAQDRKLHAVAWENNRKKLVVVVSARASGVS